jgi:4-amino-4-deoxy-L-arabinose transferase-like glycosyltransferase
MHTLAEIIEINMSAIDDVAYPMILGIEYLLAGGVSDVLIPYIVKSVLGAWCAIFIYRTTKRHFGEGAAHIAAIFVCLNPNIIYWCGTMMKEAEMVFFCCLAVDKFDEALSSNTQLTIKALLPGILSGFVLLFMRTTLGLALFGALMVHILLVDKRIISIGKKIFMGVLMVLVLSVVVGDHLMEQSKGYIEKAQSDYQHSNMEWRSEREGGNSFAKYASATVFAPLIFTLPFPTFNQAYEAQLLQVQLSGGYFIKNILSFFVIIVLAQLLITGEWRKHVLLIGYTCGYLVVLVFSGYAQSGRFHMPIWPMLMIFAAYGVQLAKSDKRMRKWFTYVLFAEVFVCLAWNWFKLAGRGII